MQAKTRQQIALLEYTFAQTSAYPYTGKVLVLAFLCGLQVKQVKSWFENECKKCIEDKDYLVVERMELMRG